ncbi:hypothetical protein [Aliivibrio fischeri]|uniref:hypothetical protein n=1 Tax=Aliivibrio fischeri TaxID=668 RepID=UPI001F46B929|nr:hypothetical protein [Aliivibrio fischeri]
MPINTPKLSRFVQAGYKPVEGGFDKKEETPPETTKERAARHKRERREELTYDASDEMRWTRNRERVLSERQLSAPQMRDSSLITKGSKAIQALDNSWGLQCSLEEELNNNHQDVVILDLDDAHKLLNNFWTDLGKDTSQIAANLNAVNGWVQHSNPIFDAKGLAKQFGDINIKADIVESKGKQFIAFSGKKNGKDILHALVNSTRINMNGKKYPINSPKVQQVGLSPKTRVNGFKGAGVLTFVVSASIATTDLVFKTDYHLVDWFGNVGSDMFKALLQFGAGEIALLGVIAATGYVVAGLIAVFLVYVSIEWLWSEYKVNDEVVKGLESVIN